MDKMDRDGKNKTKRTLLVVLQLCPVKGHRG